MAAPLSAQLARLGPPPLTAPGADEWYLRAPFAGVNIYHVDRWREMEGGQVFYNQTAANAGSRTMPSQWNFIPVLRGVTVESDYSASTL